MAIAENLEKILGEIPDDVQLIAISKTKSNEEIMEAYRQGQRILGENKVQELTAKQPDLPKDIQWHFVGHLQSNKVKQIAPFISLIHSVDKLKLLKEINKRAKNEDRVIDCLLQFHIAEEESKFGLDVEEAKDLINSEIFPQLQHMRIRGVMGMATFTENEDQIRKEFKMLKNSFDFLKANYFRESEHFSEISMGMTNDYKIAIEEGSTMVRIGSAIFGERNY